MQLQLLSIEMETLPKTVEEMGFLWSACRSTYSLTQSGTPSHATDLYIKDQLIAFNISSLNLHTPARQLASTTSSSMLFHSFYVSKN